MRRNKHFETTCLALACFILLVGCSSTSETEWPRTTNESKPWTRWWWFGSDVNSANITYNLEALAQAGIGGVELTPIYGVKGREKHCIDYLSPEWMDHFGFTLSEAARLGMGVDMNNGTGWPFGGPEVTVDDAATRALFQEYTLKGGEPLNELIEVRDEGQKEFARLDKLIAYSTDGEATDITEHVAPDGTLNWEAPAGQEYKLIALFVGKTGQRVKRAAPGGEGYVLDHFDKDAVKRYLAKFDSAFERNGTPFPNAFFNDSYEVYGADWTPTLLDEFELRRGYKLQDHFPELLADGATETSTRVITDYRETIGELLKENFTLTWTEWAHSHGVKVRNQAHGSPANLLDLYASVDIPECESFGITDFDIPYLRKDSIRKESDSDPAILKYASSAAHVAGKRYTSSETLTWLTEHFRTSLSQAKPEIDQMFTSGVNRVYFQGTVYSPQEAEWPGWKFYASVDMSPTNTIWRDAPSLFNYITRVQSFLQSGEPDNDFLLYFPIYDIWEKQRGGYFTAFVIHGMRERLPDFCGTVDRIMECGYNLDYISDHFIGTTRVEKGWLKTEGGATYKALILPAVKLIPLETMRRITELIRQGATVIFTDRYPSDVPGLTRLEERRVQFKELTALLPEVSSFNGVTTSKLGKGTVITGHNYKEMLSRWEENEETFVSDLGGQLTRRSHDDGYIYFLAMLSDNPVNQWVTLGTHAESVLFFDPMNGEKGLAATRKNNGRTEVYLQLNPGESIILKTFSNKKIEADRWCYYEHTGNEIPLDNGWTLRFEASEPEVTDSFEVDTLGSWTHLDNEILKRNMGTAVYSVSFHLQKRPGTEYLLSLGDVRESARVKVNGQDAGTLFAVPFQKTIGALLHDGANTLEIEVTNLPANRIADYDRRGVEWRIFHDINIVDVAYQHTKYDTWDVVDSGLLGPVTLQELNVIDP
jgi:hypothetical protein